MPKTLQGLRVGAYVRVSEDKSDDAEAVGRQQKDTAALIEREGGTVAHVYEENDTSAYRKRRVQRTDERGQTLTVYRVLRPVYQQMLTDLRSGVIDAAVVYDVDRLARDPRDLEDAIEVVEHYKRPILGATGGLDLLTDNGRAMARVLVAMANKSSADTARRVKRKHLDNAEQGIPVGGARPFGWQDDKRTLDDTEAELVKEAAVRVLAGAPLSAIVTDWNRRGIVTTRGNAWTPKALGGVLANPRVCGYSARNRTAPDGRTVLTIVQVDGQPVQGVWEPIVSVREWEALCLALTPRRRRPGGNVHRYLLSGIAGCGKCGAPMRGLLRNRTRAGLVYTTFAYQCHSAALGGCGGTSVMGPATDTLITEAVFQRYEREKPEPEALPVWDREDDLARAEQNLADLTAAWKRGDVDSADYFGLRGDLSTEEKALRTERAQVFAAHTAAVAAPGDLRTEWEGYSLAQKRAALSALLVAVEVKPYVRGAAIADRLVPIWR